MITPKELFKQKKFPRWITSHNLFKEIGKINKIFPGIGLSNFCEEYDVDNGIATLNAGKAVLSTIKEQVDKRKTGLEKFKEKGLSEKRATYIEHMVAQLDAVSSVIDQSKSETFLTKTSNGSYTINFTKDIFAKYDDKKPIFRKGERVFRAYNKLNTELSSHKLNSMRELEKTNSFKAFSAKNIPSKKFNIVFSSDGVEGLWDIATMSMRGVVSCQSWDGQYKQCLIGSMLDPFVGIIYLTSGDKNFNEYGSQMIKRCVVRFAIDETTREKHLLLDNMYPGFEQKVCDAFIDVLGKRTGGKIKIKYAQTSDNIHKLYMPLTELREKLGNDGEKQTQYETNASYQDYFIKSQKSTVKDKKAVLFEENSKKKTDKFVGVFRKAFVEASRSVDVSSVSDKVKAALEKISGSSEDALKKVGTYYGHTTVWNYADVVKHIADIIAKDTIKTIDQKQFNNSDTYIRRVYFTYLTKKKDIFKLVEKKLTKELNGKLALKKKLKSNDVLDLLNVMSPKIDEILKTKLKELTEKRKEAFSGAAPLPS